MAAPVANYWRKKLLEKRSTATADALWGSVQDFMVPPLDREDMVGDALEILESKVNSRAHQRGMPLETGHQARHALADVLLGSKGFHR